VRLTLAIALLLTFFAAGVAYSRLPGTRQAGIFAIDPPTPYFRYSNGNPKGRILVVHGLDANKNMMNMFCYGLADAGFEVFSIDLPGHGASESPFNAVLAQQAVSRVLEKLGSGTSALGHSLGAGFLLDFANDHPLNDLVLFSPAPTPIAKIEARRVMVFVGQLDIGRFRAFASQAAIAGEGKSDFTEVPWTGHSGALTKPGVIRQTADWLGGDSSRIHTTKRLALLLVMFVSSVAAGIILLGGSKPSPLPLTPLFDVKTVIVSYAGAAWAAVAVLAFVRVAGWLHLFATGYLMGFFFLAGLILCLGGIRIQVAPRPLLIAILAAAYTILVPGLLVASEFVQMTLPAGRWWRFPALFFLGLPLMVADEFLIRPLRSRWKRTLLFFLTRLLFNATMVAATLIWSRDSAFLLLIVYVLLFFWLALWLAGGVLRRRLQDAFATAVFIAILQAWLFAALFVKT
jgi:hypothetical protein